MLGFSMWSYSMPTFYVFEPGSQTFVTSLSFSNSAKYYSFHTIADKLEVSSNTGL